MENWIRKVVFTSVLLCVCFISQAQNGFFKDFWVPADTLNKKRFNIALVSSSALYTGFSIGLYNTWYRQYPQTKFHLFNDWNEWNNMDKAGHLYTAYFQGVLTYKGSRWTGLDEDDSILVGALAGSIFQSTIEIMDSFSEKWGFSLTDMAANVVGTSAFVLQQKAWGEQKLSFKVSSWPSSYSTEQLFSTNNLATSSLDLRTADLFGAGYFESFLKDYNAQIIWASVNLNSVIKRDTKIPDWLNVAVGYGSENLFGGFENEWMDGQNTFVVDETLYPRYHQYYLGLDVDLTRIKVKSPFLKSLLSVLNIFKIPLPAVEYNSLGNLKLHAFSR